MKIFYSKWIQIQQITKITVLENQLLIRGPLGFLFLQLPSEISFEQTNQGYRLFGISEKKNLVLTNFKLLKNALRGVYIGFSEILLITGVGWRVSLVDQILTFSLGFSHLITYYVPSNIEVIIYDKQCFKIFGLQMQNVQQIVADLCKLRIFNIYKGKGIYKQGKIFKLKESSKSKS